MLLLKSPFAIRTSFFYVSFIISCNYFFIYVEINQLCDCF
ncbi:hypothetical protein EUBHAL_01389 [Anaerobutyricum hallii DSM 3353]|uniref:Lipoprotein n=1 Tax=Anaerobutyricum hallii DSM 3353 TaxID=411469 RepID=C0EVF1_9FIRM|nr:hypothetical protein EUBHAL_01389 [Anaerobutyricum hallii DSM 3353]